MDSRMIKEIRSISWGEFKQHFDQKVDDDGVVVARVYPTVDGNEMEVYTFTRTVELKVDGNETQQQ